MSAIDGRAWLAQAHWQRGRREDARRLLATGASDDACWTIRVLDNDAGTRRAAMICSAPRATSSSPTAMSIARGVLFFSRLA